MNWPKQYPVAEPHQVQNEMPGGSQGERERPLTLHQRRKRDCDCQYQRGEDQCVSVVSQAVSDERRGKEQGEGLVHDVGQHGANDQRAVV